MRRRPSLLVPTLACGLGLSAGVARAGPLDLDEPAPPAKDGAAAGTSASTPAATPKGHAYTLAECLSLADRNHPNLWAARARLAYVHAQLEEIKWIPFWQFTSNVGVAVLPPLYGTAQYSQSVPSARINFDQ